MRPFDTSPARVANRSRGTRHRKLPPAVVVEVDGDFIELRWVHVLLEHEARTGGCSAVRSAAERSSMVSVLELPSRRFHECRIPQEAGDISAGQGRSKSARSFGVRRLSLAASTMVESGTETSTPLA